MIKGNDLSREEKILINVISGHTPHCTQDIEQCFINFNKSFDDTLRHLEYATMFGLSITEPIPLTEDWLIRFGFDKRPNSEMVQFWFINSFQLYHECYIHTTTTNREYFELSNYYDIVGSSQEIIHVHQLQNLYHALTNEELTIK